MLDFKQQTGRIFAGLSLLWALAHAPGALALGFGDIRLDSALNQPLDARIPLVSLSENERNTLSVQVASTALFKRFGIERTALADALHIEVDPGGTGGAMLHLTTQRPVREPFLRFLLEASTAEGRALREYTVLLDPPGHAPLVAATPTPARAVAERKPQSAPAAASNPAAATPASSSGRYGPVAAGDTLFHIASRLKPAGSSLSQMQVALYRANPQAFNANMNVLLRGAMLSVPDADEVRGIDRADAMATVRAQRGAFLAAAAPPPAQSKADKTMPETVATEPQPTRNARLRLEAPRVADSSATAGVRTGSGGAFGRLAVPDFSRFAASTRGETAPAATPVQPDRAGTPPGNADAMVTNGPGSTRSATSPGAMATQTAETAGEADTRPAADPSATASTPSETTAAEAPKAGAPAEHPNAATAQQEPGTVTVGQSGETPTTDGKTAPDNAVPLDVAGERDVAEGSGSLLSARRLLIVLAVALVALLLALWYRRRQYKPVPLDFTAASVEDEAERDAPPAVAAKRANDGEPSAEPATPATMPGPAAAGVAPHVQVLDADRQMKIGLFDQARQTLEEGLQRHPEHAGLQDKCLELDYLVGDAAHFSQDVARFDSALSGNGVRWAGVAAMGRILLPHDSRFVLGSTARPVAAPAAIAPTTARETEETTAHSSLNDRPKPAPTQSDDATPATAAEPIVEDASAAPPEPELPPIAEAPMKSNGVAHEDANNHGLNLDTDAADLSDYDWHSAPLEPGDARQHDRGDDPGMAFELDTSEFPESASPAKDAQRHTPVPQIAADGYDLDKPDASAGQDAKDSDPIEIRLDLARMYLEMEDGDAARDLLEEAVAQGSETQRQTARTLLAQI